jgi:hypothetical protein
VTSALIAEISSAITAASGEVFQVASQSSASGGCINRSLTLLGGDGRRFFV